MSYILDNNRVEIPNLTFETYGFNAADNADSDFIGFSFNGVHSSDLGIIRVSDGSRFNENLLPTMSDKTVQVTGGDGTYYFGSYYTQRQISVSFAYNRMSETQFRQIRSWAGDKWTHDLIFDELPYRVWNAKVTGTPTMKYVCFNEDGARVYKGEGTLVFTCYTPYAKIPNNKKYLKYYSSSIYHTKSEWAAASGMLTSNLSSERSAAEGYANIDFDVYKAINKGIQIYNKGDLPTNWKLRLLFVSDGTTYQIPKLRLKLNNSTDLCMNIDAITRTNASDAYIQFDSKTRLVEGFTSAGKKTGTVYNSYIASGDFFELPITGTTPDVFVISKMEGDQEVRIPETHIGADATPSFDYDILLL